MTPERIDLKAQDGDAAYAAKDAPQSGDVAGAGVTDGGAVGSLDKEEYFACSQAILRLYVFGYLTGVEKNRARKRLIMKPPRIVPPTAQSQERTEPSSPPAAPEASSRLRGATTTEST